MIPPPDREGPIPLMRTLPIHHRRAVPTAAAAVSLAALLTACGGGGSTKAASASRTTTPSAASAAPAGGGFPGVFGSVAALSGSSMEVQNPSSGQTTVNWNGSTTFAQTVTLTAAQLVAGECATVAGTTTNGAITARSVSVSSPSASGTCPAGFGAARRAVAGGTPGSFPGRSVPTGSVPARGRGRFLAGGDFASGKVVSSSATSLVIYGTSFTGAGRAPQSATPPTTAGPADITFGLTSSTTITEIKPTTSSGLAVGDCVTATGPADSTGAVSARIIRITSTGGQSCTARFGRFGGGSGAPAPAGSSASA